MTTRTTISKRVRYAVLTRDNFTCQYCRANGPDTKLQVDHVVPVALGGSDDPSNLVTACEPCNSGKTSTSPTDEQVATANEAAMRWSFAMRLAAQEVRAQRAAVDAQLNSWLDRWNSWTYTSQGVKHTVPLPGDWRTSIRAMLEAGADLETLVEMVDVAMASKARDEWKYFCGCAWNQIRSLQERALEIVEGSTRQASDPATSSDDTVREAFWSGHAAGYDTGYQDGWEAGLGAGKAATGERDHHDDPISLADLLAAPPPKDE